MKPKNAQLSFSSRAARVQYALLMLLYRLAVNRYLFGIFARNLARLFGSDNAVFQNLDSGVRFKIYLDDTYWTRFALFVGNYEPEVDQVLRASAQHTDLFCDLGANKGYWSVRASGLFENVHAVEAASETFKYLCENTRSLNNVTLHKAAIHTHSGEVFTFVNTHNSHASARLASRNEVIPPGSTENVKTLSIDDLVPNNAAALIKLDVEGAEISAINGAMRTLEEGSLLIYEDHGSDQTCGPSAHLLNLPNISLYSIENGLHQLTDISEIQSAKTDRYKGYNFLAARRDSPLLAAIIQDFANP